MKQSNREAMERAIGVIEGASYGAGQKVQDALALAVNIIVVVLSDEEDQS